MGNLGYNGSDLTFLDDERYSFVSGKGLCVNSHEGPEDILWRHDGIGCYATHSLTGNIVFASLSESKPLEFIDLSTRETVKTLDNPAAAEITDLAISRNGTKMYALTGVKDPKLLVWDITRDELILQENLKTLYDSVRINPADDRMFALFGGKGASFGTLNDINGEESISLEKINLASKKFSQDSEEEKLLQSIQANTVTFCIWAPYDYLLIGNRAGKVVEVHIADRKNVNVLRKSKMPSSDGEDGTAGAYPTAAALGMGFCVVSTNLGQVLWFPSVGFDSQPSTDIPVLDMSNTLQRVDIKALVTALSIDRFSHRLLVGTADRGILATVMDIQERTQGEGEDILDVSASMDNQLEPVEVDAEEVLRSQTGAVICAHPLVFTVGSTDVVQTLLTGSHTGHFSVWRHAVPDQEAPSLSAPQLLCSAKTGLGTAPSTVCSMTVLPFRAKTGTNLVVFGLDTGWVEFWELTCTSEKTDSGEGKISVSCRKLATKRLYETAVTSVDSSTFQTSAGPVFAVAAASFSHEVVHVLELFNTPQGTLAYDVRNTFKVEEGGSPVSLSWHHDSLLIGQSNGKMCQFSSSSGLCGTNKLLFPRYETSWDMGDDQVVTSAYIKSKEPVVVTLPAARTFFKFLELKDVGYVEASVNHDGIIVAVASSPNGKLLATGTVNGTVYVWERVDGVGFQQLGPSKVLHADAISSLCFSGDNSMVLSCGLDGSFFMTLVSEATFIKPNMKTMKLTENPPNDHTFTTFTNELETWLYHREGKALELLRFVNKDNLASLEVALAEVRAKHAALLQENEARSDLEKMDISEFVVDVSRRDEIVSSSENKAKELHEAYLRSNSLNELLAARVKNMCIDSMEANSRPVLPIKDTDKSSSVTSFSVRKYSAEETAQLSRVMLLRAIEVRMQETHGGVVNKVPSGKRRCAWSTSMVGIPETIDWIALEGVRWPCEDVVKMLADREESRLAASAKKQKGGGEVEEAEPEEELAIVDDDEPEEDANKRDFDDNDIFNLLYPPQAVRTSVQKRTQISLLKEVNRMVRSKFNEHFDKLVSDKEDVLSATESRNARIKTIMGELKIEEELFEPQWSNVEIQNSAVKVGDEELKSRPYESEKDRAKREALEEEERRRAAEKDADNVMGRALIDMMNGELSVKKDVLGDGDMVKPAWMDEMDPKDMTELQLKELEEWDDKVRAHAEEQAKYKQALQIELKKLKQDNEDAAKEFDVKLREMLKVKVAVQKELLSQELYMTHLALGLTKRDQTWSSLKKNAALLDDATASRGILRAKIDKFSVEVDAMKKMLNDSQEEEKNLDKSFNRSLADATGQTYDIDSLKVFKTLFRMRTYPATGEELDESLELSRSKDGAYAGTEESKAGGVEGQPSVSSVSVVHQDDPFYSYHLDKIKNKRLEAAQIPLLEPLDEARDVPDNFSADQETFDALQQLRFAKIEREIETKKLSMRFQELSAKQEQLISEDDALVSMISDLKELREGTLSLLQHLENNVEVVVCLHQGNDEVDRDAVVTDYSQSLMIPAAVIDKFNARVLEHGKRKTNVLGRIKQFRRKINIIDWNASHLTLQADHYEEYFTDLQLLRVTRDLQTVIREGSNEAQAKARLETIAQRKDFMHKSAEIKIGKIESVNEKLKRNLREKTMEMTTLQQKITDLQADVAERQGVQRSRDAARGATGDAHASATAKMKKVVARRQLVDTARAQAEEVDYLRSELDKMRQRTFPSFAKAKKF